MPGQCPFNIQTETRPIVLKEEQETAIKKLFQPWSCLNKAK